MCQLSSFIVVLSVALGCSMANVQDVCSRECVQELLAPDQGLISLIVRLTNKNITETGNYSYLVNEIPPGIKTTFSSPDEAEEYLSDLHSTIQTLQEMGSRTAPSRLTPINSAEETTTPESGRKAKLMSTDERDFSQRVSAKRPNRNEDASSEEDDNRSLEIDGDLAYPVELQPDGRIVVLYQNRRYDTTDLQNLVYRISSDERTKLVRELQTLGFPITREGRPMTDNYSGPRVSVSLKSSSDGRYQLTINGEVFDLPDDNHRVSEYLKRQSKITYEVLRRLKKFGISFNVDQGLEQPLLDDSYILKSDPNKVFITVRGVDYEIPAKFPELSKKVDRKELRRIFNALLRDGFPVEMNGNVITQSSALPRELTETITDIDVIQPEKSVVFSIDHQSYRLPKQREILLSVLKERPSLRHELLRTLLKHKIGVNLNTLDLELPDPDASNERDNETNYDLIATKSGQLEILLAGSTLRVPEDLPRLSQLVSSTTLVTIITRLRHLGIPVSMQNNRVVIQTEGTSSYRIEVEAKTRNKILVSVVISMNGERYVLPQDAEAFQAAIHREPAMTFQLFKLLAKYHVPVEFNEKSGQITFTFESEEDDDGDSVQSTGTTSAVPYEILSKNGKTIIRIGSEDLVIPRDLQRLSTILDRQNIQRLVSELRSFGTPVELRGTRILVTREQKTSYRIALQVTTLRKQPIRAVVTINNDRYELPRDEERFQAFLMQVPAVKYKIFQLLSSRNIPMRYENGTKRLQIKFAQLGSRPPANGGILSAGFRRGESNQQNSMAYQK